MDITVLFDAGLSVNEARVYMALLDLGSASVNDIVKKSGVHRVNAYDVIERLKIKGLISSILKSNKRYYEVANPEELVKLLDAKRENLAEIMPELKLIYDQRGEKQPSARLRAITARVSLGRTRKVRAGRGDSCIHPRPTSSHSAKMPWL